MGGRRANRALPAVRHDSVIGFASGYPVTGEFLKQMHDHWLGAA